jgi:hypothetical protein
MENWVEQYVSECREEVKDIVGGNLKIDEFL